MFWINEWGFFPNDKSKTIRQYLDNEGEPITLISAASNVLFKRRSDDCEITFGTNN